MLRGQQLLRQGPHRRVPEAAGHREPLRPERDPRPEPRHREGTTAIAQPEDRGDEGHQRHQDLPVRGQGTQGRRHRDRPERHAGRRREGLDPGGQQAAGGAWIQGPSDEPGSGAPTVEITLSDVDEAGDDHQARLMTLTAAKAPPDGGGWP